MPDWLWRTRETALERLVLSPLLPAEGLYRVGASLHRTAYRRGWLPRVRLPARVVSVGNLTVGGSAKTPLVAWLARQLRARGHKVAVLSRGVGGTRQRAINVVSDGKRVLSTPDEVGDEPLWIAGASPGVPVLAGRNRAALGLRALAVFGSEVLLLDDGFQHHRLVRDVDLVCVDASLGLGNRHVLPRGPLREPVGALNLADALVITRRRPGDAPGLESVSPLIPRFGFDLEPLALRPVSGGERLAPSALRGLRLGLLAGIARPDRLREHLVEMGGDVVAEHVRPDHHGYTRAEIASLDRGLPWVTTGKDAVKIPPEWANGLRLWVIEEGTPSGSGSDLLDWLARRLTGRGAAG